MSDKTTDCGSVSAELAALVADLRGEGDCWSADRVEQTIARLRDTESGSYAQGGEYHLSTEQGRAVDRALARSLEPADFGTMECRSIADQQWLDRESESVARMVWPSFDEDPEPWRRSMRVGAAAAAIMQTSQSRPEPRKDAAETVRGWLSCEHLSMSGALPATEQESVTRRSPDAFDKVALDARLARDRSRTHVLIRLDEVYAMLAYAGFDTETLARATEVSA